MRVYIGSFWDKDYRFTEMEHLFEIERKDLIADLKALPRHSAVRKVNEFVKRARRAKVHALIMEHLRSQFGWFGQEKKQQNLFDSMDKQFRSNR
eukprot:UN04278